MCVCVCVWAVADPSPLPDEYKYIEKSLPAVRLARRWRKLSLQLKQYSDGSEHHGGTYFSQSVFTINLVIPRSQTELPSKTSCVMP